MTSEGARQLLQAWYRRQILRDHATHAPITFAWLHGRRALMCGGCGTVDIYGSVAKVAS
jgi:hypothetical protein